MTKEQIQRRLQELTDELNKVIAMQHRIEGAMLAYQEMLAALDAPPAADEGSASKG